MKKTFIRIFTAMLCMVILSVVLPGCDRETNENTSVDVIKNTAKKTLRLCNNSNYPIGPVNIVTPEGLTDADKRVYLIGLSDIQLEPGENGEYVVEIPEKDLSAVWYLSVRGSVDNGSVEREREVGTIWEDGVKGFDVFWDDEEENFYFSPFFDDYD